MFPPASLQTQTHRNALTHLWGSKAESENTQHKDMFGNSLSKRLDHSCLLCEEQASGQTISPELVSISCSDRYSTNTTNAAYASASSPSRGETAIPCPASSQGVYSQKGGDSQVSQ